MKAALIAVNPAATRFVTLTLSVRWPNLSLAQASTGVEGVALVGRLSPELILLIPDFTDLELSTVIREIRQASHAPLVVLGHKGDQMEAVNSLTSGADDYVRLPCGMTELTVRIWAAMRRTSTTVNHQDGEPLRSGELLLNLATHEAFLGDQLIHLTATEFRLLHALIRNCGSVMTHSILERTLWEEDTNSHGLIKKYIQRLRRKLGDDAKTPHWIACIHGIGYRFVGPAPTNRDVMIDLTDANLTKPLAGVPA